MKLLAAVLLSAVALVSADTGYQEPGTGYQAQYQPDNVYSQPVNNNNNAPHKNGLMSLLQKLFGGGVRGQVGTGVGGLIGTAVPVVVMAVIAFSAFNSLFSSGRGLDTDEWEVDHSVWMDQLQRDFEDSWSTE